ncbi:putative transient receptor potential cation channel subfamily A member 1-like, partial [Apostichopus japonicus]
DHFGRTPLHLAANEGFVSTIEALLETHPHLLNQTDDSGNTALQVAACAGRVNVVTFLLDRKTAITKNNLGISVFRMAIESRHRDVAMAIIMNDRWREALDDCPVNQEPYILGLIKYLPDVALALLNRCHKRSYSHSGSHREEFDFRYLRCTQEEQSKFRLPGEAIEPLIVLNTMVKHNRIDLLSHPVCVNYLHMKWHTYGRFVHVTTMGVYLLFVASLTVFIWIIDPHPLPTSTQKTNKTISSSDEFLKSTASPFHLRVSEFTKFQMFIVWFIAVFSTLNILKEVVQFLHQWPCGAVAVFLAWFNFLLYLQRFDIFGIYVVMFLEILRTLCQVLVVFSILIIAFALTFHILLPHEENNAHSTPIASLLRVGMPFLLGELDFVNSFIEPSTDNDPFTLPYPILTFIFLFGLVLLLPILLINLLIGLAVGDIASMQRNAQLKRLAMQVELHSDLEQKLPNSILKAGDKERYTIQSNCAKFYLVQLWEKLRPARSGVESAYGNTSETEDEIQGDPQLAALKVELNHQKRRWRDVKTQIDRQHDMLKLILQKMEIQSEAEERDEGVGPNSRGER